MEILKRQFALSLSVMTMRLSTLVIKFLFTLYVAKFIDFEALGVYGLVFSATIVSNAVVGLSLMYTISRNAVSQKLNEVCTALKFYLKYTTLMYSILSVLALCYGVYHSKYLFPLVFTTILFVEHVSNDFYVLLLNLERPFSANALHFVRTALWMLAYIATSFFFEDYRSTESMLEFWLAGCFVSLALLAFLVKEWPWATGSETTSLFLWLKAELARSLAIYFTSLITTISSYSNLYFISIFLDVALAGVYTYFIQVTTALINLVHTGMIQLLRPKLVRAYKEDISQFMLEYKKGVRNTMALSFVMAVFTGIALRYTTIYLDKALAIKWLVLIWPFMIFFLVQIYVEVTALFFYSTFNDPLFFKLTLISSVIKLFFGLIFIPQYGLWAAVLVPIAGSVLVLPFQRKYMTRVI